MGPLISLMLGLKATAVRVLRVEREKHPWGGSGEGECQVQGVRGREAHLGSITLSPRQASPSVTLHCSCSHPDATGWRGLGGVAPPASSVYPGERREETRL